MDVSTHWRNDMKNWPMVDQRLIEMLEQSFPSSIPATLADAKDQRLDLRVAHLAGANDVIQKLKQVERAQRKERER